MYTNPYISAESLPIETPSSQPPCGYRARRDLRASPTFSSSRMASRYSYS